jgi:hypothetical protein
MRKEQSDPRIDLRPKIAIGWIKRVIEVENPSIDMFERVADQSFIGASRRGISI